MSQNTKAIAFENELDLISDLLQIHNHSMNKKMEVFYSKNLKHDTKEHDLYLVDLAKWGYADLGETFNSKRNFTVRSLMNCYIFLYRSDYIINYYSWIPLPLA